ncbi:MULTISPECIES: LysR family transcriptional regulator [Bradyrhizobium]|uniref:LysR family transcriptional regulator n=1 Tax=Bradyrhizobium elkanii TaxID=29448 RepID=UPI000415CA74|nr:LysR family transcriptional regulator [Bradyrhizobium elkanii]
MDIKQIAYFQAVADCGSFAKASERLHISQPAISAQIGQLEAELAATLLVRHARGIRLTPAGVVFLEHGREILAKIEQARSAVADLDREVSGSVTIAMITTIANVVAPRLLERAKLIFPKLEVKIFEALSGEVTAWHAGSRFDLSILYLPDTHKVVGATPFLNERLYLLGPIDRDRELGEPVRFADLGGVPLHHTSRIHACRLLLDSMASKLNVELNIVAEIDSITLLYDFVAARNAYSVFPCIGEAPEFQRAVDYRPIIEPALALQSYIVRATNRPNCRPINAVVQLLSELAEEITSPHKVTRQECSVGA